MRFNDSHLRRAYASNGRRWPSHQRTNGMDYNSMGYDANELPYNYCASPPPPPENPFRQWELNSENNSFRPANVRRITDGTYPYGGHQLQQQQQREHQQRQSAANAVPIGNATVAAGTAKEVRLEINNQPFVEGSSSATSTSNSTPSTSRTVIASTSGGANNSKLKNDHGESSSASASSSKSQLRLDRQAFESGALSSSTESASETENKVRSPELSGRRYSENTEDDQYNNSTGTSSSTDDDGDGGVGDGDDDENDDTISELHTIDTTDNSERN